MKKKILSLLIAGAMAVTMLTSCNNSGETVDTDTTNNVAEEVDQLAAQTQSRDLITEDYTDKLIIEFISSVEDDVVCGIWYTQYSVGRTISNGENYHLSENEVLIEYVKDTDSTTVSIGGPIFENTRMITENIKLREFKKEEFDHVGFAISKGDTELFRVTFTREIDTLISEETTLWEETEQE